MLPVSHCQRGRWELLPSGVSADTAIVSEDLRARLARLPMEDWANLEKKGVSWIATGASIVGTALGGFEAGEAIARARWLLDRGATLNKPDRFGRLLFSDLVSPGILVWTPGLGDFLRENGFDPGIRDGAGYGLGHHWGIEQLKLDPGGRLGQSALDWLDWILAHGVDPNAKDLQGNTTLHLLMQSSRGNREEVVAALLDRGAGVDLENDDGHTALGLASHHQRLEALSVMQARLRYQTALAEQAGLDSMLRPIPPAPSPGLSRRL
jgi:hypothetical protein